MRVGLVEQAMGLIREALAKGERPVVAYSGGKDSVVLLDLVRQVAPRVPIAWNNTGIEYPETIAFVRVETERLGLDLYEFKPATTFWKIRARTGWDFIRKGDRREHRQGLAEKCCYHLKHKPMFQGIAANRWDLLFVGLRASESRQRGMAAKRDGDYFYSKSWRAWKCHPILWWTDEDIWAYIAERGLPCNPIYDFRFPDTREVRTGCWPCPLIIPHGYLKWLRQYNPAYFRTLLKVGGLGELLVRHKLAAEGPLFAPPTPEQLLDMQECFFDEVRIR